MKTLLNKNEAWHYYEDKLPKWINDYLGHNHQHIIADDYEEPHNKWETYIDEDGKTCYNTTKEYDEWFDHDQQLMYDEKSIINIIKALIEGYEIIKLKNPNEFRIKKLK